MSMELITFPYCPFGQRCLIALHEKGVAFDTTFVDLDDPPDWLAGVSPLGKVPVLRTRGKAIFDSAVINEYLDETIEPSLYPVDALERALQRSWIAFAGELLTAQVAAYKAKSRRSFEEKLEKLGERVMLLAAAPVAGPYFGGARFSPVDAAYAPFFLRTRIMAGRHEGLGPLPAGLEAWADALAERPSVIRSVPPEFESGYLDFLKAKGSWLLGSN